MDDKFFDKIREKVIDKWPRISPDMADDITEFTVNRIDEDRTLIFGLHYKEKKIDYIYFISFMQLRDGKMEYGNTAMVLTKKIEGWADIADIERGLKLRSNIKEVCVMNFVLLREEYG